MRICPGWLRLRCGVPSAASGSSTTSTTACCSSWGLLGLLAPTSSSCSSVRSSRASTCMAPWNAVSTTAQLWSAALTTFWQHDYGCLPRNALVAGAGAAAGKPAASVRSGDSRPVQRTCAYWDCRLCKTMLRALLAPSADRRHASRSTSLQGQQHMAEVSARARCMCS